MLIDTTSNLTVKRAKLVKLQPRTTLHVSLVVPQAQSRMESASVLIQAYTFLIKIKMGLKGLRSNVSLARTALTPTVKSRDGSVFRAPTLARSLIKY
jgi:hypothetical protein